MTSTNDSLKHLIQRLGLIEARVRLAVASRRAIDANPDDRFRGLYVSDGHVDELLDNSRDQVAFEPLLREVAATELWADQAAAEGSDLRLRRLARDFDLDAIDVETLLIALAPDVDPRFERLYGYLNDDVTKRRATIGLALEMCGIPASDLHGRKRLFPGSPLTAGGLISVEENDRPFLSRSLRVPDRVAAHLLGDDAHDFALASMIPGTFEGDIPGAEELSRALAGRAMLCYLRERAGAAGMSLAQTAFRQVGIKPLVLDLTMLKADSDSHVIAALAGREARLGLSGIVAGPIEVLAERGPGAVRAFADVDAALILVGSRPWDPDWSVRIPLVLDAPVLDSSARSEIWIRTLSDAVRKGLDPAQATDQFRLSPRQIERSVRAAELRALSAGRPLLESDLRAGARAQNAAGLDYLARRIRPTANWDDLVLPNNVERNLHELASRARYRELVLEGWGMGGRSGRGRGVTALFAGESGTGKTLAAEVIAGELDLDVYAIDLSSVVDKYIGETEKNLDRIFVEAERVNGIVLFDEADALFGKRSEVRDARDRYANVEIAYLLQRMESFDGIAILATNLRANIDEAFARRLDILIDFPFPDESSRLLLWMKHLPTSVPRTGDVDLEFLARAFELSGGSIRNVTLAAAFFAAAAGREVEMADLITGTEREYRKLGRLCLESEFGPYFDVLRDDRHTVATAPNGRSQHGG